MKRSVLIPALLLSFSFAQAQHLQVNGKFLQDASGHNMILRGINYPIMDDGSVNPDDPATYKPRIDDFAETGANCIRIPWNTDGVHWRDNPGSGGTPGTMQGYIDNGKLGDMISYCYTKNLVVILEIHDITCQNDWSSFDNIVSDFWLNSNMINLINTHQSGFILNIANEFGYDGDWGGDITTFRDHYISAIEDIRAAGIEVPIMIDAPDCGMASSSLVSIAGDLLAADDNLIFSVHSYWTAYAATDAAIDARMDEMSSSAGCFVFGEVANKQDVDVCGDTDISDIYKRVLTRACPLEMGWLAWCYHNDCSPERQVTSDGTFTGLTVYGDDIVNNTEYGLKSAGPCSGSAGMSTDIPAPGFALQQPQLYPNPGTGIFCLSPASHIQSVHAYDPMGREIRLVSKGNGQYQLQGAAPGIYLIRYRLKNGTSHTERLSYLR